MRAEQVLIVDDDPAERLLLISALERDGYDFLEAGDGETAVAEFEEQRPDIVLMDALMPNMDGFEATARILALAGGDRPPVLMVTSLQEEAAIERAFNAGAMDFIPKPVHYGVLRHRVRRLLDGHLAERNLIRLANHDPLTGLANRTLFADRLGNAMSRVRRDGKSLALLLLDIDNFKIINDTLGHEVGDDVLVLLAERLTRSVRDYDSAARLGGDEFALLLEGAHSRANVRTVVDRILAAVREPSLVDGREVIVTGSIGVSTFPRDGEDISTLTMHADTAMYRAKEAGGNAIRFYDAQMSVAGKRRLQLESALRQAIGRNEISVHYQPQIDMNTGTVVGFEALVRWTHPDLGVLPPLDFIPLAEETGVIVGIGEWVLHQACLQCRKWQDEGRVGIRISVNLSGRQLADPSLVDRVKQALAGAGLEAQFLELELTESSLLPNDRRTCESLAGLRDLGVRLSVDDFGTEYASLSYLKKFPVTGIKIDRSFVAGLPDDAQDAAIVESVLVLARGFGLSVVAEGIESQAQLEFLRDLGCDEGQGYLIGRPCAPEFYAPSNEFAMPVRDGEAAQISTAAG